MTGVLNTARQVRTVLLPPLTLRVTEYTLAAGRDYRTQPDIAGGIHLRSPGMELHTLTLRGFFTRANAAAAAVTLSGMLTAQTALTFPLDGVQFTNLHVASYEVRDGADSRAAAFQITLVGTAEIAAEVTA